MKKTLLRQKIFLVVFGFFTVVVFLEIGLRVAGFIFLTIQENANKASLAKSGEYRILCLGESTTALGGENSYPRQLERILNEEQHQTKFSVINKGFPATTTEQILSRLKIYIDKYQPRIVIAMMGVNDPADSPDKDKMVSKGGDVFSHLQVVKLVKMIRAHVMSKGNEIRSSQLEKKLSELEKAIDRDPSSENFAHLINLYRAAHKPEKEIAMIKKAQAMYPQNPVVWGLYGVYCHRNAEYDEAVTAYQKALELNLGHPDYALFVLGWLGDCYKLQGKYQLAKETFQKIIQQSPLNETAYASMGEIYFEEGQCAEAQSFFEKQLSINPKATSSYSKLAYCYRLKGENDKAEQLLRQGVNKNPEVPNLYLELGSALMMHQGYTEAEKIFKEALASNHENDKGMNADIYHRLVQCYEAQGKSEQAREVKGIIDARKENYNTRTSDNYQKLQEVLLRQKVQLVAVQYPLRDISPLKKMLQSAKGVIFVNNKEIFEEVVAKDGFDAYFYDRFAGDFGHCTPKGNHLLASNIAQTLLANLGYAH